MPQTVETYQKVRKDTEDWDDSKKLLEEIPEYLLMRDFCSEQTL